MHARPDEPLDESEYPDPRDLAEPDAEDAALSDLATCPECGRAVFALAPACPHCKRELRELRLAPRRWRRRTRRLAAALVMAGIVLVGTGVLAPLARLPDWLLR